MAERLPVQGQLCGPRTVGPVIGFAFGIAVSTLVLFRLGGLALFVPYLAFAPIVFSPAAGALLARTRAIPPVHPVSLICLALVFASAPLAAGFIETRQRDHPFPIPDRTEVTGWKSYPWGESILILAAPEEVPVFFDRLVRAANGAGWQCHDCTYQPSSGTGHASFHSRHDDGSAHSGHMGFEVWPGEMALYATAPSELTLARVYHHRPARSPRLAVLAMSVLLATVMLVRVARRSNR